MWCVLYCVVFAYLLVAISSKNEPAYMSTWFSVSLCERLQQTPQSVSRHCDSVLQEFPVSHSHDQDCEMDGDECLQEQSGSPCASGGLHMPNSVMNFTRRAHRMRYFSTCLPSVHQQIMSDRNIGSTGSSPGNGASFPSGKVRRTNSCPEMEKSPGMQPILLEIQVIAVEDFHNVLTVVL